MLLNSPADYTTTNDPVEVPGSRTKLLGFRAIKVVAKNTHASNVVKWAVIGVVKNGDEEVILQAGTTTLAGVTQAVYNIAAADEGFEEIYVTGESNADGNAGTLRLRIIGARSNIP